MAFARANAPMRQSLRLLAATEGPALQRTPRLATPLAARLLQQRPLSASAALLKKRKVAVPSNSPKHHHKETTTTTAAAAAAAPETAAPADHNGGGAALDPEDPLDLTAVLAAYAPVDTHFRAQLAGMAHGGRFNPANLGSLPVAVKHEHPGDDAPAAFPLRELAQVVPRSGRTISLLVHDKAYIKPIMSAVQGSKDFNQQPQRADDNDLELLLKVELERKDDVVRRLKDTTQAWRERIRHVRSRHEKVLKDWKKNGTVLPDLVKRAEKELQKVQDKKMKEIDQEEAQLIRQLERN